MTDESKYLELADQTLRVVNDAFDDIDPDQVDVYASGDVLTLAFANGTKAVLNTQRPTRQLWFAANARAWHFSYDLPSGRWVDDKGRGAELFETLRSVVREQAGVDVKFKAP